MSETPSVCRHLHIHGRVQGVYYRASMVEQALALGVSGWVRNRRDGSVEALVCGPAEAVEELIDWSRQGPAQARVEGVAVAEAEGPPPAGFEQRPTA
ncbi:acylphosphatase [Xylophilus rhododendri]|uniref:acylphosphatase n=1 Tax=Xylophilus rhododendri TaxID=2697032 RepID=A0A857J841_9BURK|nr:acylphosphatase [Xylophilus rhododendri]QHI99241.1 acylphosphatase [Xylophilus rhododendri]